MMKKTGRLLALWVLLLIPCSFVQAQQGSSKPTPLQVPRIEGKVVINGKPDEPAWQDALELDLPFETDPGENIPAPVKTKVWIFYDRSNIYFALYCFDPHPETIRSRYSERDQIENDDLININLDTFNDERRNYFFGCNPLGVQRDGIETIGGDLSWDAIWDSAGQIVPDGYIIELAIPFSSLQFQRASGPQIWGLDISRWYPRSQRHRLGLVKIDRNNNSYQNQFLKIQGFAGIKPGKNLEIVPTLTGTRTDERAALPGGAFAPLTKKLEPGITVQWGITANLNLNGTANPDFSQVEADSRQLDINQPFAQFYQEKRPFFTEGMDFFRSPYNVIYTRTLRDPVWGFKLTGKEGANTVGAYFVRDDLTNLIFPGSQESSSTSLDMGSSATVLRYKLDLGNKYTLGALLTNREGEDYFNRVYGIDGEARFTDRNKFRFQFLGSATRYPEDTSQAFSQPGGTLQDRALYLSYQYQSRNLNAYASWYDVGGRFRADLGFMPRVDFREFDGGMAYSWIKSLGWWSVLSLGYNFSYTEDQRQDFLSRLNELSFFFRGAMQSWLQVLVDHKREMFQNQTFQLLSAQAFLMFQPAANMQVGLIGKIGDRIDYANIRSGQRLQLNPAVTFNFGRRLTLNLDHNYERMRVNRQRLYTANITQGTVIYHLNTRIFFRTILQYVNYDYNAANYLEVIDPQFKHFFSQFLFSYKLNPRTVMFIGYTDNYLGNQDFSLTQSDRTIFLKISYSWQL